MPVRVGVAGMLFFSALSAAETGAGSLPATFSTSARMVLVPVSVTDRDGKTIMGLRAEDFTVYDDQTRQPLASFSSQDAPSSVGMVLDISGSMQRVLEALKGGARTFVRNANPRDEFLVLTVSTAPSVAPNFIADSDEVEAGIAGLRPGGLTALLDTADLGFRQMRQAKNPRRAMIIFSDGLDNHSRYSREALLREALEADTQVYTIIFHTGSGGSSSGGAPFRPSMVAKPGDQARQNQAPDLLEKLAEKTGGLSFHARSGGDLLEAVAKTGEAVRNQYLIAYRMPDSDLSGKWHRIRVKVDLPKANVHARSGYYAR